jgi:RNA polymerase sigma-70 factor, ECF subfamily
MDERQQPDAVPSGLQQINMTLVAAACQGDSHAANSLLIQSYPRVLRFLAHLTGDRELSRDLAQETMLSVSQGIGRLASPESFDSWLLRIARNTYRSARHQPKFRTPYSLDWMLQHPDSQRVVSRINESIESYPEREVVWQALALLSPTAREIIYLSHLSGHSGKEIGEIVDISPSAVYQRLHRAEIDFKHIHDKLTEVSERRASELPQWEH